MQKIINVMAVASFVVSAGVVATGITIYTNQEEIVESIKEQVIQGVSEVLPDLVGGIVGGLGMGSDLAPSMPDAPTSPATTDLSIPGF